MALQENDRSHVVEKPWATAVLPKACHLILLNRAGFTTAERVDVIGHSADFCF